MRVVIGAVAAVLVGLLGGLIVGEYQLLGAWALIAGVLFGLVVAEATITVGKSSDWFIVTVAAAAAFGGYAWSAYIEAGDSFGRIGALRWMGALLALASAGWWVRSLGSRSLRTPPAEESA